MLRSALLFVQGVSYPYALPILNPGAETNSITPWAAISPKTVDPGIGVSGTDASTKDGAYYFVGANSAANTWWGQTVDLDSSLTFDIDNGNLQVDATVWHAGFSGNSDTGALAIEFLTQSLDWLAGRFPAQTDPSTWSVDSLSIRVPPNARKFRISTRNVRNSGTQLSAYYDLFAAQLSKAADANALLYSLRFADVSSWTNVIGTLATATEAGFGIDTVFDWTASASGDAYYPISITDSGQLSTIDNGSAYVKYHARHSNYDGLNDPGRMYLEFYDVSATLIGSRYYSHTSAYIAPIYGEDVLLDAPVPVGTRTIRTGIQGYRTSGAALDAQFSEIAVFITGMPLVSNVASSGGGGSVVGDLYRSFPLQSIRDMPTAIGKRAFPIT